MIPDEAVEAALEGALPLIYENLSLPYGASVTDYPDLEDLRAADAEADKKNNEILREILRAALDAAAPHMLAAAWDEGYEGAVDAYDGRNVSNPYRKTDDARG